MAGGYRIRRVRPDEWAPWKRIRLDALRSDPLAFGSTLETELGFPDSRWQDRVRRGAGPGLESAFVACASDGSWVGMGGTFVADGRMHVYGMWVDPAHRGHGVGRRILETIVAHHLAEAPRAPLELQANPAQTAARSLYEHVGFAATGETEPLGHHPPAVVERFVRPAARRSPEAGGP